MQRNLVTIYVSVIRPVLEYACPVWHTNLNRHLTESIETVHKRALTCIYPGNEYADILARQPKCEFFANLAVKVPQWVVIDSI